MRLLVTRPEPDASETAAKLRAAGHEVTVEPLLEMVFHPPPVGLPTPAVLVATSRNGVRAMAGWPEAAGWRDVPIYVTGRATADEARGLGFRTVRPADGDAAGLAELIVAEVAKDIGPVIYAGARDRTGALAGGLVAAGYDLRLVEAYRAERPIRLSAATGQALRDKAIDGVLLYSRRTALAFRNLVEGADLSRGLGGVVVYALSERVAEPVRSIPGLRIVVAAEPDAEALMGLVEKPE